MFVADQQVGLLDQLRGLGGHAVQAVVADADDVNFFRGVQGSTPLCDSAMGVAVLPSRPPPVLEADCKTNRRR